ncbi:glycoside hydrolase family 75 protein [Streptomyces sp. Je 1-332]|uniref:glycoside hydrolase family 75 protein n=1 Tax=Streptomyces sp. Je 1-332 TaxID=3231270 RepID=UPI003459C524
MRIGNAALGAAVGVVLLVPASLPAAAYPQERKSLAIRGGSPDPVSQEGPVSAAALLARTATCQQVSLGKYRTDGGAPANVPVCGKRGAVFWKADMDIDCDGRPSRACNRRTDPLFQNTTAFQESGGRQLSAEGLPYVVVPGASRIWSHTRHGITGGSVAAVIHGGKVLYAVVGDTGPTDLIGEASYAAAKSLGINPDPRSGGTDAGVTYIVFTGPKASPIESHRAAVARGDALARQFLGQN